MATIKESLESEVEKLRADVAEEMQAAGNKLREAEGRLADFLAGVPAEIHAMDSSVWAAIKAFFGRA